MSKKLTQFNPPGYLPDFTPASAKLWSDTFVSPRMTREATLPQVSQFYNEVTSAHDTGPAVRAIIPWVAFPNTVNHDFPGDNDRWRRAEEAGPKGEPRHYQDEYCEWSVKRDAAHDGKVTKIVFTAEGPEYWEYLARWQPDTVVQLYKAHNPGFDIRKEDLFSGGGSGAYNPLNKWNNRSDSGAIMHLVQRNNTLGAQFHLGGQATVLRIDGAGNPVSDPDSLLRCSRLGGAYRNSDPFIGIQINNLARATKGLLTIPDPLGLYIHSYDFSNFSAPDGTDVNTFWTWTRGTPADPSIGRRDNHWVRAVFEVPAYKNYVVGDILDDKGNEIQWGGQLADHVQIRLAGQYIREGLHAAGSYPCIGASQKMGVATTSAVAEEEEEEEEGGYSYDRADGLDIVTEGCCD